MGNGTKVNGNSYPKLRRPATLDFLSAKPKPWRIVDIHGDLDAVNDLTAAEKALGDAELRARTDPTHGAEVTKAKAEVDKARRRVEETTMQLLVAGIGKHAKEELVNLHPPRDEDHQSARDSTGNENARAEYNLDTYPPALIAASLVEPKLSADEVAQLLAGWTDGEYLTLWMAAIQVNADSSLVGLGKGRGLNDSNGTNGSTKS